MNSVSQKHDEFKRLSWMKCKINRSLLPEALIAEIKHFSNPPSKTSLLWLLLENKFHAACRLHPSSTAVLQYSWNLNCSLLTLSLQAADMQWIYDVKGKTSQDHQLLRKSSTKDSLPAPLPPRERRRNFVVQNLRIPFLANSSPVKVKK